MESGLSTTYNASLYEVKRSLEDGETSGLTEHFVVRDKAKKQFFLFQGKDAKDPKKKFVAMAQSFDDHVRIYAQNSLKYPESFDPEKHQAAVHF